MVSLRIQLLGTFQVLQNGRPLTTFRTDKIRALLAYLAVESNRPHRRDTLSALFWPEMDDQKARYNLRLSLHRLRQSLGENASSLQVNRQSVCCDPAQIWVDVTAFEQAITAIFQHDHAHPTHCPDCMTQLETAVTHYHGDFLPGFFLDNDLAFAEWAAARREQLHQQALQAMAWLTTFHQKKGRINHAIPYARRQLELEPWHEPAHRQLMTILAQSGQRAASINQYEICCRILRDELGVDPAAETKALYEQINDDRVTRQQGEEKHDPHLFTLSSFHPFTLSTTPFIGRQKELDTLNRLLDDVTVRLVTITGTGGMGKTRLALACADAQKRRVDNRFPHGVFMAPLTAVTHPDHILPAIAAAIAFTPESGDGRTDARQLLDFLQNRQLLLALDNFEQLLNEDQSQSGTAIIHQLLQHAPHLKLLVTSRERLHLQGEYVLPLTGLLCPDSSDADIARYSAVQLFQQSARRRQPDFTLLPDDLPHLIAICRLLDGMPLGLELAAAWVDVLPLSQIASEIQRSLDFLTADWQAWPDRHRSMRAVFDASWTRLSQPERALFSRLTVFRSGFTRAAVQVIAGEGQSHTAILRLMSTLVSKSLLRHDRPTDRYTLHPLLLQYGAEKVGDKTLTAQHGRYFCRWLQRQTDALKGGRQKATMASIKMDLDNIRAAWTWATAGPHVPFLRAAAFSLGLFLQRTGRHREGLTLFGRAAAALAHPETPVEWAALARLLYWQAIFEPVTKRQQTWLQSALEAWHQAGDASDEDDEAAILLALGIVAHEQGRHTEAEQFYEQSLTRCRLLGDRWDEANALYELGVSAWSQGKYTEAAQRHEQSLHIRQRLQDLVGTAVSLEGLAGTAMFVGDGDQAIAYTRQSLEIYRQLEDRVGTAVLQAELGHKTWYQNLEGMELIEDSLRIFADLGTRHHLAHWTVILAMYRADVDITAAEKLAQRGLALCREIGYLRGVAIAYGVLSRAAWMKEDYGRAQELAQIYLRLTDEMSLPLERSDALCWSAWAHLAVGEGDIAKEQVRTVLQTRNLWQLAVLNLAAVLLVTFFPEQSGWAWQLQGLGEHRYGRLRGAVSQEMVRRFLPEALRVTPPEEIAQLKETGCRMQVDVVFPRLLAALA